MDSWGLSGFVTPLGEVRCHHEVSGRWTLRRVARDTDLGRTRLLAACPQPGDPKVTDSSYLCDSPACSVTSMPTFHLILAQLRADPFPLLHGCHLQPRDPKEGFSVGRAVTALLGEGRVETALLGGCIPDW